MHIITWQVRSSVSTSYRLEALHPSRGYYITSEERISGSGLQYLIYIQKYRESVLLQYRVIRVHKVLLQTREAKHPPAKKFSVFQTGKQTSSRTYDHCFGSSFGTTFEQKQQNSVVSSPTTTWVRKPWVRSVLSQVLPWVRICWLKGVKVRLIKNQRLCLQKCLLIVDP
jgi:hypothetical protein